MVRASLQPLERMTSAALPVKAPKQTSPSMSSARCRASVVLPVPAKPNRRNTCGRPRFSQADTSASALSCWGDQAMARGILKGFATPCLWHSGPAEANRQAAATASVA